MRNLARYSILLVLLLGVCSCKEENKEKKSIIKRILRFRDDDRHVTFSIPELGGTECSKRLLHALNQHNGILNAMPDLTNRTVSVEYNSRITAIKNIEHAISKVGFDVDDTKGNAEAKDKLPSDCR